ncbi:hypothetical protein FN846DRAFT_889545 [Sphaerosporella brunnea]|uniref:Uncharacterized protein n=1 Tax=Sphaerosporella brunnea TaxID=1250544 RepID=A0A5J5EZB6_9PEZI|nr:hypothetical protein FN846DRAFT_889545 [Sphaerosporella brunnea]
MPNLFPRMAMHAQSQWPEGHCGETPKLGGQLRPFFIVFVMLHSKLVDVPIPEFTQRLSKRYKWSTDPAGFRTSASWTSSSIHHFVGRDSRHAQSWGSPFTQLSRQGMITVAKVKHKHLPIGETLQNLGPNIAEGTESGRMLDIWAFQGALTVTTETAVKRAPPGPCTLCSQITTYMAPPMYACIAAGWSDVQVDNINPGLNITPPISLTMAKAKV